MNRHHYLALFGCLLLVAGNAAEYASDRPHFMALRPETRAVVLAWLNQDCGAAEQNALTSRLAGVKEPLEPVFWEAYRLGPPPEQLARDRAEIAKRYGSRQAWLRASGTTLFGGQEVKRLLAVSEEQYVARETANNITGFKTAVLSALGIIGTRSSVDELKRISAERENPVSATAAEALKAIEQRANRRP